MVPFKVWSLTRRLQIKCDKAVPCSSCGTLGISCKVAGVETAAAEVRSGVSTISNISGH